jgi:hypothetical protein
MNAYVSPPALLAAVCALCAAALLTPAARAQTDDSQRDHAIAIGQGAIELYEQGQYRVALERFRTAERALHSPVFALYEARCLEKLGRLVEAKHAYQLVVAERLTAEAPPAWRAAQSDAAVELAALLRRVPSARIAISGAVAVSLALDGAPLDVSSSRSELWLDAGVHELEARDGAGRTARARFELREGERDQRVELLFLAEAAEPARAPTGAAHGTRSKPATDTLGVALLSAGAAGLVTGAVTGVMAVGKVRRIREACVGNACRASDKEEGHSAATLALISTIGFAVGGASVGAWSLRVILTPAERGASAFSAPPTVRVIGTF